MAVAEEQLPAQKGRIPVTPVKDKLPTTKLRQCCIKIANSWWLDYITIAIILVSCLSKVNYNPCKGEERYHVIVGAVVFFYVLWEMVVKMVAMGIYGRPESYLSNRWNKLDFALTCAQIVDIINDSFGFPLGFGPALLSLRLISKTKSLRGLVSLLVNIAPMITSVVVMYLLVIHVFAVIGVQLWMGELNNRCFLGEDIVTMYNLSLSPYYVSAPGETDSFLCSTEDMNGNRRCTDIPPYKEGGKDCTLEAPPENWPGNWSASGGDCVNWNIYYNVCRPDGPNPYIESLNFNNIRHAWFTIFQLMTFEGWTEVMHYVMDTHSFWSFGYFVLVTLIGTFIFLNTCAVVIATFFSEAMINGSEDTCSFTSPFLTWCYGLIKKLLDRVAARLPNCSCSKGKNVSTRVKKIVDCNLFSGGILFAIFLDTVSMAVQHHGQPLEMTEVLKICNYLFTAVFTMEIVLKVLAYGHLYFMEGSNLFDFTIVMISLCDVAGLFNTGLPAVRALRMMRFGRLVNNFPYLKRQLMLLCRTLGKVFTLLLLMVLFVFAFGVMGMYMFGCRYDDRQNFDSLTWSMLTVFQLLTQEDWNLVLYNAMSSTSGWSAIYFVVTSMIGNNILLNVLMSIVVESFQTAPPIEEDAKTSSAVPNPKDGPTASTHSGREVSAVRKRNPCQRFLSCFQRPLQWFREHKEWTFFLLPPHNRFRILCQKLVQHKYFDWSIMLFILIGCVTNAFERPAIMPDSTERTVLNIFSDVLVAIFSVEMAVKVTAKGFVYGENNYCKSIWNILDGFLVISSLGQVLFMLVASGQTRLFSLMKVLRLLRALRPLRVIKRVPKLKLAVEALVSSVKPMANIILISCVFLFFFGIVGVQLFKGQFSYCVGEDTSMIVNKSDCLAANYQWVQNTFNFDNLLQALLTLFVMYSKDGWLGVMYDGLDAVDVNKQPKKNYNQWPLMYFILFMVMSMFLLDMFIGVMVETFHQCRQAQKQEDNGKPPDSIPSTQNAVAPLEENTATHSYIVKLSTSRVWDILATIIISCNIVIMAFEHHGQPKYLTILGDCAHYVFTLFMGVEVLLIFVAFGWKQLMKKRLNLAILIASIISAVFSLLNTTRKVTFSLNALRVCHILRLAQVLKDRRLTVLIRTITKTLSQVGHICLLFFFLFFIFAVLGVELFGKLACTPDYPCDGINRYTHFKNFPMALLALYAVCTGDNWNGILKDTLRECRPDDADCSSYLRWASPLYFITFVIVAQFVLANLVVAAIVQALDDSKKESSVGNNRAEQLRPPEADSSSLKSAEV